MADNRIEDIGEKIGGAKKDLWKNRYMTISDLDNLNDIEKDKFVTKDMIWHKPDYQKLYEEKDENAELVAAIKVLRDRIAAKPRKLDKRYKLDNPYESYIEIISMVRDLVMNADSIEDLKKVHSIIGNNFNSIDVYTIYKGNTSPLYFSYSELRSAQKLVNKGFPLEKQTRKTKDTGDKKKNPLKKKLDKLNIYGMSYELKDSITGEDFIDTFNFRGVEFGNYLNQKERQDTINIAYKSLMDLSDILQIQPKDISFNGTLAIAFGARGSGTALAHYEPARRVLNMTKLKGAGSLAHEWFHGFDHYIGSGEDFNVKIYASNTDRHPLHNEFKLLRDSITRRVLSNEEYFQDIRDNIDKLGVEFQERLDKADSFEESGKYNQTVLEKYRKDLNNYYLPKIDLLEKKLSLYADDVSLIPDTDKIRKSEFLKEALILDDNKAGKYWSKLIELSARSFESYIFDELVKRDSRSDYLVHSVEEGLYANKAIYRGEPHPIGKERKKINEAYSNVMEAFRNHYINNNKFTY